MANKKDSEHEEHEAENEALKAKIQNEFLKMALAPDELLAQEEPTISPAVVLDENYEETPSSVSPSTAPPKIMEEGVEQPPPVSIASNEVKPVEVKPVPAVTEPPKQKPALGAAEFLLSGTLPKKEVPTPESSVPPVENEPSATSEEASKKETEAHAISQEEKPEDEEESKGGMFAKAKSLFSNITKKDKKE